MFAIEEAGMQLATGRDAVVVCVWQPVDVGFVPISKQHFDADQAPEVRKEAEETAAYGASLANRAGFLAQSMAVEAAPTWKGIVETAAERHASLIVVGTHRRGGLVGHLLAASLRRCRTRTLRGVHRPPATILNGYLRVASEPRRATPWPKART